MSPAVPKSIVSATSVIVPPLAAVIVLSAVSNVPVPALIVIAPSTDVLMPPPNVSVVAALVKLKFPAAVDAFNVATSLALVNVIDPATALFATTSAAVIFVVPS